MSTTMKVVPETINRIADGAYPALAMLAGMQLNLFTPLQDGPMTGDEIAQVIGVGTEKLNPLLYALVASNLLTVDGDRFANTTESARFLVEGKPDYVGHRHHGMSSRWGNILHTTESIQKGEAAAKVDFSTISQEDVESSSRTRHQEAVAAGVELAARYDFSRYNEMLEVGGRTGGLTFGVLESNPHIQVTVVDLPATTPVTERYVQESGFAGRLQVRASDVVEGTLEGSYDAVIMKSFIQVLNPGQARRALANIHRVTQPGGSVYILGAVLDDSRLSPSEAVAFSLNFLNIYDGGQSYTESEYRDWLTEAGFEGIERVVVSDGSSIIAAEKPGLAVG